MPRIFLAGAYTRFARLGDSRAKGNRVDTSENSQPVKMNQEITFLSDGDDKLRELQLEMSPMATHILDWFHLVRQEVARVIVWHGTGRDPTWCPITSTLGGEAGR